MAIWFNKVIDAWNRVEFSIKMSKFERDFSWRWLHNGPLLTEKAPSD